MARRRFKLKKGFIVQQVTDGIVIFDAEESKLYTFNETASLIFQGLKSRKTVKQIAEKLMEKYEVSLERAKKEIESLIQSIETLHIIETYE